MISKANHTIINLVFNEIMKENMKNIIKTYM